MAKALDPEIAAILTKYGLGKDAIWDCHGTWVMYHWAVERAAAKAGIKFDQPFIVEAHSVEGVAAVCVSGRLGEQVIWSIGEASPKNNKNAYPWAMAEKRGIDRVALKLLGLSGQVYSEEEADDFKPKGTAAAISGPIGQLAPKDDQADMLALDWFDGAGEKAATIRGVEDFMVAIFKAAKNTPALFTSNEHTLKWLETEYGTAKCGRKTVAQAARDVRLAFDAQGAMA